MPSKKDQHPLISKLKVQDKALKNVILKYTECPIGKYELREIFSIFLENNDTTNLKIMLDFDYSDFFELEEDHPFYLESEPFTPLPFILNSIQEANSFGHKKASVFLQDRISEWLDLVLSNQENLFSRKVSHAINAVSLYQPERAYQRLSIELKKQFEFTEEIYESRYYSKILNALKNLSKNIDYFAFAADKLWEFSIEEIDLSEEDDSDEALPIFASLFKTSSSIIPLSERMGFLSKKITSAKYWPGKYALIKALDMVAKIFSSPLDEENDMADPELKAYLDFSIDKLMQYAVLKNYDELSNPAQEAIHRLLKSTIDKHNIDAPYRIFKHYRHENQAWKTCPFSHINKLESKIKKLERRGKVYEEKINLLEKRLSTLSGFMENSSREFIVKDFTLALSAKKVEKHCEIGLEVDDATKLALHERQSLAERLFYLQKKDLNNIQRSWPKCTYIVANLGMLISDRAHEQGGEHRRVFKSMPIKIPHATLNIIASSSFGAHAEKGFYEHFLKDSNIRHYLNEFKQKFNINSNRKIYAVIFDLHGTYDMCLSCSKSGVEFQEKFREKILQILPEQAFTTLTKYPSQLPIIIRYSSDRSYHYSNSIEETKLGILSLIEQNDIKNGYFLEEPSNSIDDLLAKRDVKQFTPNLLLHGARNWHSWPDNRQNKYIKERRGKRVPIDVHYLEPRSAFVSQNAYSRLSIEQKKFSYISEIGDLSEPMSRLSM